MSHKIKTTEVRAEVESLDCTGSSNVLAAEYFKDSGTDGIHHAMTITFKTGKYEYYDVHQDVWAKFKAAPSKGEFVNRVIIGPDRKNPIYKGLKIN